MVGSLVIFVLISLAVSPLSIGAWASTRPQRAPDLSGLSTDEKRMIADACSLDRQLNGPAEYYACVRGQLTALRDSPGKPDLSGLSADEKAMIADACSLDRQLNGPAEYYTCVRGQLATLRDSPGKPDLSGLSADEKAMIADACSLDRQLNGPAEYYGCVRGQLASLGFKPPPSARTRKAARTPARIPPTNQLSPVSPRNVPPVTGTATHNEKSEWGFISVLVGLYFFIYLGRAAYVKLAMEKCSVCGVRTSKATRICDSCELRAEESRQREARRQAEEARQRYAEAQAAEQRRREEESRRKFRTLEDLRHLNGTEFERFIASLFTKDGYKVSSRAGSGDEGIDLLLEIGTSRDVVQCKRWKADIGSPIIREFYGSMMHAGARRGFIITTASFTQSAREFVIGKPITLIDGEHLIAWINGAGSSGRGEAGSGQKRDVGFNPYETLGVSRGASKNEIRSAYVNLIARYHPDKVAHLGHEFQAIAKEKSLAINRAYQMLSNT